MAYHVTFSNCPKFIYSSQSSTSYFPSLQAEEKSLKLTLGSDQDQILFSTSLCVTLNYLPSPSTLSFQFSCIQTLTCEGCFWSQQWLLCPSGQYLLSFVIFCFHLGFSRKRSCDRFEFKSIEVYLFRKWLQETPLGQW